MPWVRRIELVNEYGNIRARGTKDGVLALSAMIQKKNSDSHQIRFDIDDADEVVKIRVVYDGKQEDTIKAKGKRRGDVTIYVPEGVSLNARTHTGLLEVKGLGDVSLETFSGRVFCRVDGLPKVKTYQGDIKAVLKGTAWEQPALLSSTLGTIEVVFPPKASLDVEAVTRGEITTDYSVTIEKEKSGLKRARARLGDGGQAVHITNETGIIKILEGNWDVDR